jgi:hypothetical protein
LQYQLLHKHQLRKKKPNQLPRQLPAHQPLLLRRRRKKLSLQKAKQKRLSLLRSNPIRAVVYSIDDSEYEVEFDDVVHRGYSRPRVEKELHDEDDDLPEYIRWRLFLARQLALLKYREKWA